MRKDWNSYFMGIAHQAATRSTCQRKHVGAVIVRDRTVLSTGYNGSLRGMPHCEDVGCIVEDGHCITTVHAEANAINRIRVMRICLDSSRAILRTCLSNLDVGSRLLCWLSASSAVNSALNVNEIIIGMRDLL